MFAASVGSSLIQDAAFPNALSLTPESIDFSAGSAIIQCLKKRGKKIFRAAPIPSDLLNQLKKLIRTYKPGTRLWDWSRMTGYRRICEVMEAAGIRGAYACPKGLRHAFGVNAIQSGVPLNLVQRWLGHADIKTTAIYTSAQGDEERLIASRMWEKRPTASASPPTDAEPVIRLDKKTQLSKEHDRPQPSLALARKATWQLRQFWLNCNSNFVYKSYGWVPACKPDIGLHRLSIISDQTPGREDINRDGAQFSDPESCPSEGHREGRGNRVAKGARRPCMTLAGAMRLGCACPGSMRCSDLWSHQTVPSRSRPSDCLKTISV